MQISTKQASEILKVTQMRVLHMIYQGKFGDNVQKFGNAYMLDADMVEQVKLDMEQDSRTNLAQLKSKARSSQPTKRGIKIVKKQK